MLEENLGYREPTTSTNFVFLYLIFLSLTPAAYVSVAGGSQDYSEHLSFVLSIYLASTLFLFSNNLFLFIFFYEMAILPIFFVLRSFGHYYRSNQAAFLILIWALMGSFFLFLGAIGLSYYGVFTFSSLPVVPPSASGAIALLLCLGFLVKVPMWPFHFWISSAHAEGPTNMSIFLSGVLVKLSVFGILSVFDLLLLNQTFFLFFFCSLIGVVDSTLNMLIQIDSKVVVAFSTTVQMNFALFILFTMSEGSYATLVVALLNHMLTASLLFFIADTILVSFNTREFFFLSGLYFYVPLLSFFLLISIVNQINFPGFLGFVLDLNFLISVLSSYPLTSFIIFFFLFGIEHLYILYFFLNVCFGVSPSFYYVSLKDLSLAEVLLFSYLLSLSVFWGVFPYTLAHLYTVINYVSFLVNATSKPVVQRLVGSALSLPNAGVYPRVNQESSAASVGAAALALTSLHFSWVYFLNPGYFLVNKSSFCSVLISGALFAVSVGSFCAAANNGVANLSLPSGALLEAESISGLRKGSAAPQLELASKASTVKQGHRKLSVSGSANNANDHYNGGKGTGGFQRFV